MMTITPFHFAHFFFSHKYKSLHIQSCYSKNDNELVQVYDVIEMPERLESCMPSNPSTIQDA